ncbi:MAG: class I SAM-dependent methyltransferase [Actinomycetota bacterium]|nr:class I SAM-dependent methyltransferase [Actinomycetota bacterium]
MPEGSLGRWPEDYERGRPGWPPGVIELVGVPPTATVLDLGAGTGKLTRLLVSAFEAVVAIEPAEAMRRLLVDLCAGVEALSGSAEAIPLADASVDAVFAAQAFHTFDDPRAIPEIARVLRADGAVILLWNLPAGPWRPSTAAAEAVLGERMPSVDYIPLDLGGPAASSGWQPAVAESPFEPFQAMVLPNPQTLDREDLLAFYATMGWLADLPDNERLPLLAEVRSLLDADSYERAWETHVHWARLRQI